MDPQSEYKSLQETAEYFGVTPHAVRDWIRKDKLPPESCIKLGGTYRLKYKLIEDWAFEEYESSKNASAEAEDNVNLESPESGAPFLIQDEDEDGEYI